MNVERDQLILNIVCRNADKRDVILYKAGNRPGYTGAAHQVSGGSYLSGNVRLKPHNAFRYRYTRRRCAALAFGLPPLKAQNRAVDEISSSAPYSLSNRLRIRDSQCHTYAVDMDQQGTLADYQKNFRRDL